MTSSIPVKWPSSPLPTTSTLNETPRASCRRPDSAAARSVFSTEESAASTMTVISSRPEADVWSTTQRYSPLDWLNSATHAPTASGKMFTPRIFTMLSARPNSFERRLCVEPQGQSPETKDKTSLVLKRIIGAACLNSAVTINVPLSPSFLVSSVCGSAISTTKESSKTCIPVLYLQSQQTVPSSFVP